MRCRTATARTGCLGTDVSIPQLSLADTQGVFLFAVIDLSGKGLARF